MELHTIKPVDGLCQCESCDVVFSTIEYDLIGVDCPCCGCSGYDQDYPMGALHYIFTEDEIGKYKVKKLRKSVTKRIGDKNAD